VQDLSQRYETFLEVVQRPEQEAIEQFSDAEYRKRALEEAKAYGDQIFQLVRLVVLPDRFRFFVT